MSNKSIEYINKINKDLYLYLNFIIDKNNKYNLNIIEKDKYLLDDYNQFIEKILNDVENYNLDHEYCEHNCEHDIIEDDIDITPEISQRIYYCRKCEKTIKKLKHIIKY
jgi:hypothetical protein